MYIGKGCIRADAQSKTTGKAIYGADIKLNGMLYAVCRYTDIVCGKVKNLNTEKAKKAKGVKAIATFNDVCGQKQIGPIRADHYPIINKDIFYSGDVLAVVAADTYQNAVNAVEQIKVEYQRKQGVFDIEEAAKTSSNLVHSQYKSNIVVEYPLVKGDVEKALVESEYTISKKYKTNFAEHAYIEPESVVAEPDFYTGGFNIYGSIQNPYTTRKVVALYLNLPLNKVNVIPSSLGGSFGGKDDIINVMACRCALLAKLTQKPVALTNTRENSITESYKRHPYILNYTAGFNKNGKINALKIHILADSGAYSSQSFFVTWRSLVQATGPYNIKHVKTNIKAVYTNNTYTAAFRGFGAPQVIFAIESLLDEIAEKCNISPLKIRQLNAYKQNAVTASGQILNKHKVSLLEVLNTASTKCKFEQKYKKYQKQKSQRYLKGIGMAVSFRGCSLGAEGTDASSAMVSIQADGSVYVSTGVTENGQGLSTVMSQIAASCLGADYNKIVFIKPDTKQVADGGPTVASRGTIMGGNAVVAACNILKKRIANFLNEQGFEEVEFKDSKIITKTKQFTFDEIALKCYNAGINLAACGWHNAPKVSWDEETGQGDAYFTYVYGCQIAEITLDAFTGKIVVDDITACHDAGTIINILQAKGQVYGGIMQGLGYGLIEDYNIENGKVKSKNFDNYLIPTIKDMPNINPIFCQNYDKDGALGAKSLGEPTLELTAAAINNAFCNAAKKRNYQIPITLEQAILGYNLKKPIRASEENIKTRKQVSKLPKLKVKVAKNIDEALNLISNNDYKILSGGTDLLVDLRKHQVKSNLLDITNIKQLKQIEFKNNILEIGACCTFNNLLTSKTVKNNFKLLMQAAKKIGSTQIRNTATIGGNIVNAATCADSIPPLLAYNAVLTLKSKTNKRLVKLEDFIEKPYKTKIKPNEILTKITISNQSFNKNFYYQLGRRQAVNITRLSLAIGANIENDCIKKINIACGSLLFKPMRLNFIEELLNNEPFSAEIINKACQKLEDYLKINIGARWSGIYKIPVFTKIFENALYSIKKDKCW